MSPRPSSAPLPPLGDLPLFRDLAPEATRTLAAAPRRRFRRGEVLWTAGAEAGALAVVLSGRVRVVRAVDAGRSAGRQYGVHTEGPGGTLGEVPFFAGGRYPATAVAAEATTCLLVDRATLARAVAADPALALRWLARLAGRVRRLVERLDQQTGRTVEQRVAALLLDRHAASKGAPFALAATQAEAAEELGTVREVLVRTLRGFREAGLVVSPMRGRYRVRDARALARLAAPSPST
jgi:CRP-like cAMP-binding protein